MPIVLARKKTLFSALGLSFVSLLLQVQIPNLLNSAVNNSLQHAWPARPPAQPLRADRLRARRRRWPDLLRGAAVPDAHRLRDRSRPAQHDLHAPDADELRLLRPRPVWPADLARQLGYPLRADVPDLRPEHPRPVLDRGRRVHLHAHDQRAARVRGDVHAAVRVRDGPAHAPQPVPGLMADPVASGRGRDDRRREHQRRPRGQVVRRRAARAARARARRRQAAVVIHPGRRCARALHAGRPEPAAGRAWRWSCCSAATS